MVHRGRFFLILMSVIFLAAFGSACRKKNDDSSSGISVRSKMFEGNWQWTKYLSDNGEDSSAGYINTDKSWILRFEDGFFAGYDLNKKKAICSSMQEYSAAGSNLVLAPSGSCAEENLHVTEQEKNKFTIRVETKGDSGTSVLFLTFERRSNAEIRDIFSTITKKTNVPSLISKFFGKKRTGGDGSDDLSDSDDQDDDADDDDDSKPVTILKPFNLKTMSGRDGSLSMSDNKYSYSFRFVHGQPIGYGSSIPAGTPNCTVLVALPTQSTATSVDIPLGTVLKTKYRHGDMIVFVDGSLIDWIICGIEGENSSDLTPTQMAEAIGGWLAL